jgi:P-type Cu+ transporter
MGDLIYASNPHPGEIAVMKDPVCGMMVDERKTKLVSEHDGTKFYFCSAGCKAAFDKDPHRFGHS